MKVINRKSVPFYSEIPDFRARLLVLVIGLGIGLPISEFVFVGLLKWIDAEWTLLSLIFVFNLFFYLILQFRFGTKKQWANLMTVSLLLLNLVWFYRIVQNDFSALLTSQLVLLIIASTFVYDRLRYLLILLIISFIAFIFTCFYITEYVENTLIFLVSIPAAFIIFIYSFILKIHRLSILEFSESVLSHYDKFVFVYNAEGDVIYVNNYAAERFQFDNSKTQYKDWWKFRGYTPEEEAVHKKVVSEAVAFDAKIPMHQMKTFLPNRDEITIEWNDQIIRQKFYIGIGSDVTQEILANLESNRISKITKALKAGIATANLEGQITWCNSYYTEIFEYSEAEIIGKRPSELFAVPAFFKDEYLALINGGIKPGIPVEIPHYTKTGRLIWILLNISNVLDENGEIFEEIEVVTDITTQKQNEFQFKQTSLIVERTQTPVFITDLNLNINWFNDAVIKEFGLVFDDVIGQNFISKFITFSQINENEISWEKAINERISLIIDMPLSRMGRQEWYKISLDPVRDDSDSVSQFMIVLQNIQDLKNQQHIIESKNQDMVSSISYAKRIQSAFLPTDQILEEEMPPHFFYYRPKDIVSGDFYYVKRRGNLLFIGVADCTGHGVPGAMITSIAAASLDNAIFDHELCDANEILELSDRFVKKALSSNSHDLTDGMDIGLIVLDFENNTIKYSGARRPLIIMENGEKKIIPPNKRSIGEFRSDLKGGFTQWEAPVNNEMNIYLFSDGIPDQFGGERLKKIGIKRLLKFIESFNNWDMHEMKHEFERQVNEWTEDFSIMQTDDMLFFAAKIDPEYMIEKKMNVVLNQE